MTPSLRGLLNSDIRELLRGTSFAAGHQLIGMGAAFIVSVMLARLLGIEGLGVYSLSATTVAIAGIVGRLGLDSAMVRYASASASQEEWDALKGIYQAGMRLALLASGGITLILVLIAPLLSNVLFDNSEIAQPMRIMALTIPPTTIAFLHGEMLKAIKLTGIASFVQSSAPPFVNIAVLGIAALSINSGLTPSQAAMAALVSVVAITVGALWIWRYFTPHLRALPAAFETRQLLRTGLPLFWVASMSVIISATDILMLGIWTDAHEVALYSATIRIVALVSFPLMAVNAIATAQFSALFATGNIKRLESVARGATYLTGILALLISVMYWTQPAALLELYGPEFAAGSTTLVILTVGRFVHTATGPVGVLLIATGREKLLQNLITASALANIFLNALLIPLYGIVGAAAASTLSMAGVKLAILYFVNFQMNIRTIPLPRLLTGNP